MRLHLKLAIVAGVLAFMVGLMAVYGAITARAVERVVLEASERDLGSGTLT